jgi:serine/threonine protein kinase
MAAPLAGTLNAQLQCGYCHHTFTHSDRADETHASATSGPVPAAPELSEPANETPSNAIGPYLLQRKLGAGSMGEVWLARDPGLDRHVAIKILPSALAEDPERLKRFLREARLGAKIDHPHTVTIFQAGVDGQRPFIAMQYVDGGSLEELIGQGQPVEWRKAARAIGQAAEGLGAAHKQGLVHRDVKPANLMRTAEGDVKVVDFGLARAQWSNTQLTQSGIRMGTPAYMAPEQWMGQEADARTDLYSLVCSLYHLVTGRLPFDAASLASLGYQHCQVPPPDPRQSVSGLPEELCRILAKGMQKAPGQRYQSAEELVPFSATW